MSLKEIEKQCGPPLNIVRDRKGGAIKEAEYSLPEGRMRVILRDGKMNKVIITKPSRLPFSASELEQILFRWQDPANGSVFVPVDYGALSPEQKMSPSEKIKLLRESLRYQSWVCLFPNGSLFALYNRDLRSLILFQEKIARK
ncbi:MAG: hypothetical protein D6820_05130, partial [Lentisphaerae bacterium]